MSLILTLNPNRIRRTHQVSVLKFNPLCYVHVFVFGMLLAALRARLDQHHRSNSSGSSSSDDHPAEGDGCDPLCINSVKPATAGDDEEGTGGRAAADRLRSLARGVSRYGACVGCVAWPAQLLSPSL